MATAVLSDSRLFVGGSDGYCAIFNPPLVEVEDSAHEYTERMYTNPLLAFIPFSSPPLKWAFDQIQGKSFQLRILSNLLQIRNLVAALLRDVLVLISL